MIPKLEKSNILNQDMFVQKYGQTIIGRGKATIVEYFYLVNLVKWETGFFPHCELSRFLAAHATVKPLWPRFTGTKAFYLLT